MRSPLIPEDYGDFLTEVKNRGQVARLMAGKAVNRELVSLYWDIGHGITEKQRNAGWGDSIVEKLAADLRAEFPHAKGFSARSVWEMKRFYLTFTNGEFLQQAVAELPFSNSNTCVTIKFEDPGKINGIRKFFVTPILHGGGRVLVILRRTIKVGHGAQRNCIHCLIRSVCYPAFCPKLFACFLILLLTPSITD